MNSLSRLVRGGAIRRAYRLAAPAVVNFSSHEGGAFAPPFVVRRPEVAPLSEHAELMWDDPYAPETCIDFELPGWKTWETYAWFFGGLAIFPVGLFLVKLTDPQGHNPAAPREVPGADHIFGDIRH